MHTSARYIRDVPDFPKPGIVFKDLTTLFREPEPLARAMTDLEAMVDWSQVDLVAGIEARGFVVAGYMAASKGVGCVLIRKPGKLPADTIREEYTLEYGTDSLEMHRDACPGARVLIVDDLLATGGTARAASRLIVSGGGIVAGFAFLVELSFLHGRDALGDVPAHALIRYDG